MIYFIAVLFALLITTFVVLVALFISRGSDWERKMHTVVISILIASAVCMVLYSLPELYDIINS